MDAMSTTAQQAQSDVPAATPVSLPASASTVVPCTEAQCLGLAAVGSFCGQESQLTNHAGDSVYPAVAFDPCGNTGIAWVDTRDGFPAIWFRILGGQVSSGALSASGVTGAACPQCGSAGTFSGGSLSVDEGAKTVTLTATGAVDFTVLSPTTIRILSGEDQNLTFSVSGSTGNSKQTLSLAYDPKAVSSSGFTYSVNPPQGLAEVRLTEGTDNCMFPDLVADKDGRFHVVYQSDKNGNFELYYVQVYPTAVGEKKLSLTSVVSVTGFPAVPSGTSGGVIPLAGGGTFMPTGTAGSRIAYGPRDLVLKPYSSGPIATREGLHTLFRDFYFGGNGSWTGVSSVNDRATWQAQIAALGISASPDYVVPTGNPVGQPGDFGTKFSFQDVAFLVQSPPDMSVKVSTIVLPIKPRKTPSAPPATGQGVTQNLVPAPKRQVPPNFTDPVDLSAIMAGPSVTVDGLLPSRYTVEGDTSGTVFTNVIVDDGRSVLVFEPAADPANGKPVFVLGQRRCGDEYCALLPGAVAGAQVQDSQTKYSITLKVFEGPDYRTDPAVAAAYAGTVSLLFEKEFSFGPNDDMSTFKLKEGDLVLPEGRSIYLVPQAGAHAEFYVEGVGNGSDVWGVTTSATEAGTTVSVAQYEPPFTVPPNGGLKAPAYFEGTLAAPLAGVTTTAATVASSSSSCPYGSTQPLRLTMSGTGTNLKDSTHPRLARTKEDDIWLAFQSDRTGSMEAYAAKYSGQYGQWSTSTSGGAEIRLSYSGDKGARSSFPGVAADSFGDAHVAWHSTETEDGLPEIFHCKSTSGGTQFSSPERVTASPGNAMMADIASVTMGGAETQVVTWHDNRSGNWEIMSAFREDGAWDSSARGGTDSRMTQAQGNSLFPRIAGDSQGNLRVAFQSERASPLVVAANSTGGLTTEFQSGAGTVMVYMASFSARDGKWQSSGQGGQDSLISTGGTDKSLNPDIDVDVSGGAFCVWHDTRLKATAEGWQEELFGSYCANLGQTIQPFGFVTPTTCGTVNANFYVCDSNGNAIGSTASRDAFLRITAPGAAFYRCASQSLSATEGDGKGGWPAWQQFSPTVELDTMIIPFKLAIGNGKKDVFVQVMTASVLGFVMSNWVVLQEAVPRIKVAFYKDQGMTVPLPTFGDHSVASLGETFVLLTSSVPLKATPTFDVIGRGLRQFRNRPTVASGTAGTMFLGRFGVGRDDGVFSIDGPAKVVTYYEEPN